MRHTYAAQKLFPFSGQPCQKFYFFKHVQLHVQLHHVSPAEPPGVPCQGDDVKLSNQWLTSRAVEPGDDEGKAQNPHEGDVCLKLYMHVYPKHSTTCMVTINGMTISMFHQNQGSGDRTEVPGWNAQQDVQSN